MPTHKKIILIVLLLAFPLICVAQEITDQTISKNAKEFAKEFNPQMIIEKTDNIMKGIYNDLLIIKNKYKELQTNLGAYYDQGEYKDEKDIRGWKEFGYLDLAEIDIYSIPGEPLSPCPYISFRFRNDFYPHEYCSASIAFIEPSYEVYIKEIGHYFVFYYKLKNIELEKELINIVKKNIENSK